MRSSSRISQLGTVRIFRPFKNCPSPTARARAHTKIARPAQAVMWDAFFCDLNYLASDLVTGKSIPVLIAVSVLPLDPNLLGTMVLLGVFLGSIVTLATAWNPPPTGAAGVFAGWGARFLNHAFSAFLSVSFLLRVSGRIYAAGASVALLPAFCVVCQYVQERPSTPFTLLVISIGLFWLGIAYEMEAMHPPAVAFGSGQDTGAQLLADHVHQSQRSLMALRPTDHWHPPARHAPGAAGPPGPPGPHPIARSLWDSLRYSLLVVALAFYATASHGPIHSYNTGDEGDPTAKRYMSVQFLYSKGYSMWPTLTAGLLRAYVYLRTAWLHGNALHLICENDSDARTISLFCAWLHVVVLLYSAAWSCTQLTEQVFPLFVGDKTQFRMHFTAALLAVAYSFRWGDDWAGFYMTLAGAGATVAAWAVGRI